MGMDGRTLAGIRKSQRKDHGDTVSGSLQLKLSELHNNRRQYKRRPRGNTLTRTARRKTKTNRFGYAMNELELFAVVWGIEHFRLYIYGKLIKLLTDRRALEPLIKRN